MLHIFKYKELIEVGTGTGIAQYSGKNKNKKTLFNQYTKLKRCVKMML